MTRQEEIREGIDKIIILWQNEDTRIGGQNPTRLRERIQEFETSQGVVIKVETWLPVRSGMTCTIEPLVEK